MCSTAFSYPRNVMNVSVSFYSSMVVIFMNFLNTDKSVIMPRPAERGHNEMTGGVYLSVNLSV